MVPKGFELTVEQIAKREARKAKKLLRQNSAVSAPVDDESRILQRPWLECSSTHTGRKIKILTWNLLAQCLVRRELFPTSNCLKAREREQMTYLEMFSHNPDIMCLQEVDRLEKILPALEKASFSHHFVAGPNKKHGCLIAFKKDNYCRIAEELVQYDNEEIRSAEGDIARRGSSFKTRNIGIIVALEDSIHRNSGVIVATTHLFWHPRYTYERARQAGILKRAVLRFRSARGLDNWPCIVAGDFNFAPDDPGYALMVGAKLQADHERHIQMSQVVHATIDPSVATGGAPTEEDEDADPDKVITNARKAHEADGLLNPSELTDLFKASGKPLRSAYDEGLRHTNIKLPTFGERKQLPVESMGAFEPPFTSYTHYWKTVLDYIFFLDPEDSARSSEVTGLLAPHKQQDMEPGLPQLNICGSDHTSLCAEVLFCPTSNQK